MVKHKFHFFIQKHRCCFWHEFRRFTSKISIEYQKRLFSCPSSLFHLTLKILLSVRRITFQILLTFFHSRRCCSEISFAPKKHKSHLSNKDTYKKPDTQFQERVKGISTKVAKHNEEKHDIQHYQVIYTDEKKGCIKSMKFMDDLNRGTFKLLKKEDNVDSHFMTKYFVYLDQCCT